MSGKRNDTTGGRAAGIVGLALVTLMAAVSLWLSGPPAPLPADAAADRFSAGRAMADVVELAQQPRPLGSAAHAAARDYLLGRMGALGLAPQVQETIAARRHGGSIRVARVQNLVGRLAGRGDRGALLLVAHYDSRPNTPGAGDDASGVAVALEIVRALAAGPPLTRDLIVLLTDAEELGRLGARGFAEEHAWMEEVELVLNFEARGSRGPAVMFETGRGDLQLLRAFARAAPKPLASSLSAEVYSRMPHDTDFSEFRSRGLAGLNFAFLGGFDAYHTALDTADRLEPGSLQQAGANALALIRHLEDRHASGEGAHGVWFNPLGGWLLVLPASAALPLAAVLTVLAVVVAALGVRRGRLEWRALRAGAAYCAAVMVLAPLAAAALWMLFSDNAAGVLDTPHRLPYRLELAGLALLLAGVSVAAVLGGLARPRRPVETALGTALVWAVLGLAAASLVPGASFLFWWPVWGLLVAAAVVMVTGPRPSLELLLVTAGALPGVALLTPLALLVLQAMTPHLALAALAPASLVLALVLAAVTAVAAGRQGVSLAVIVASLATLALSVWGGPDERRPRTADLVHLQELDTGAAWWVSRDERPSSWVLERMGGEPQSWEAPAYLAGSSGEVLRHAAPQLDAVGPEADEGEDLRLDGRRLTVRLRSETGAPVIAAVASSTVQISEVEVAGRSFERDGEEATKPLRLLLVGLSPEGLEVSFQLPDRWPVELDLTEQFYGLPDGPRLPPELIPDDDWTSHSRLVHRSVLR